ncbi:hypothetical protein D3C73_765610 [compost metagenome]
MTSLCGQRRKRGLLLLQEKEGLSISIRKTKSQQPFLIYLAIGQAILCALRSIHVIFVIKRLELIY